MNGPSARPVASREAGLPDTRERLRSQIELLQTVLLGVDGRQSLQERLDLSVRLRRELIALIPTLGWDPEEPRPSDCAARIEADHR